MVICNRRIGRSPGAAHRVLLPSLWQQQPPPGETYPRLRPDPGMRWPRGGATARACAWSPRRLVIQGMEEWNRRFVVTASAPIRHEQTSTDPELRSRICICAGQPDQRGSAATVTASSGWSPDVGGSLCAIAGSRPAGLDQVGVGHEVEELADVVVDAGVRGTPRNARSRRTLGLAMQPVPCVTRRPPLAEQKSLVHNVFRCTEPPVGCGRVSGAGNRWRRD
jgi:hypothetical protein